MLIVGAVLGLALIYTGASRPYTKLLLSHGAVSALAVALLAGWWFSRRKRIEPKRMGPSAGHDRCRGRHRVWRQVLARLVEQALRHPQSRDRATCR